MKTPRTIDRIQAKLKNRAIQLSPPVAEADVVEFEKSNGLRLPQDYRDFLLCVGRSGLGPPTCGLCGFGETPTSFDLGRIDLSRPFPFTRPWVWEAEAISDEGGKAEICCGIVVLGTDGCGQFWALIVRGPETGKIWMLTDVGIQPTVPSMTFTDWYEAWLDGRTEWWG